MSTENVTEKPFYDQLQLQLTEVELLKSMYPGTGEVTIDGELLLENIQRYTEGKREALPKQLAYIVRVQVEKKQVSYKYEFQFQNHLLLARGVCTLIYGGRQHEGTN